jgi:peptide-methionine (S)-S-oxide reductase
MTNQTAIATLGGGCFWCIEAALHELVGVASVVSGYAGGHVSSPTYEQICGKKTGHAEVVQVTFDPTILSYRDLLGMFFALHDPTTPDRQGNDVGPQYRSVIFAHNEEQAATAREMIAEVEREQVYGAAPVVTQVLPVPHFWPAEAYHQRYFENNPDQPYCAYVVEPKVAKFRMKYASRLIRTVAG